MPDERDSFKKINDLLEQGKRDGLIDEAFADKIKEAVQNLSKEKPGSLSETVSIKYEPLDPAVIISGEGIIDKIDRKDHARPCKVQSHSASRRQVDADKESICFDIMKGTNKISIYGYKNALGGDLTALVERIKAAL